MKKTKASGPHRSDSDELRAEYKFDYRKAKPNRFAARFRKGSVVVTLDPDVATIFTDAEAVNSVLRALIATMPHGTK